MDSPASRGLVARIAEDTWFWSVVTILFCFVSILKGLRLPNLWAATQANLDYDQGFIKRGLFGQVAHSLGIPIVHYQVFVLFSGLLLLILAALLGWWVSRSGARRLGNGVVVAVFSASYIVTYLTQLAGYLEIPLAALALVALSTSALGGRLTGVLIAAALGVLIHESYVLTFLPMTLLPAFLAAFDSRRPLRAVAPIAAVVAVIVLVLLLTALAAPMTVQRASGLQAAMAATVDFPTRGDFFPVLTRSAADNMAIMMKTMSSGLWWLAQLNAFVTFMPTAAFFLWIALDIVDTRGDPEPQRLAVKAAVVSAGLCPLSMQLFGYDIYRWYALAAFSSFVSMTVVCNRYGVPPASIRSGALRNLGMLLIAINMAAGTGLFDGSRVDTFPFVDFWRSVIRLIGAGGHFPQPAA